MTATRVQCKLPNPLLLKCISFLSCTCLLKLRLVSKRFKTSIQLHLSSVSELQFDQKLSNYVRAHSLLPSFLTTCKSLEVVSLQLCDFSFTITSSLFTYIPSTTSIKLLNPVSLTNKFANRFYAIQCNQLKPLLSYTISPQNKELHLFLVKAFPRSLDSRVIARHLLALTNWIGSQEAHLTHFFGNFSAAKAYGEFIDLFLLPALSKFNLTKLTLTRFPDLLNNSDKYFNDNCIQELVSDRFISPEVVNAFLVNRRNHLPFSIEMMIQKSHQLSTITDKATKLNLAIVSNSEVIDLKRLYRLESLKMEICDVFKELLLPESLYFLSIDAECLNADFKFNFPPFLNEIEFCTTEIGFYDLILSIEDLNYLKRMSFLNCTIVFSGRHWNLLPTKPSFPSTEVLLDYTGCHHAGDGTEPPFNLCWVCYSRVSSLFKSLELVPGMDSISEGEGSEVGEGEDIIGNMDLSDVD
ncbi:hypothetical protein P9112_003004 [Eukaryota sp. TZLM1-RC]